MQRPLVNFPLHNFLFFYSPDPFLAAKALYGKRKNLLRTLLSVSDPAVRQVAEWLRECLAFAWKRYDVGKTKVLLNGGVDLRDFQDRKLTLKDRTISHVSRDFLDYLLSEPRLWPTLVFEENPLETTVIKQDTDLYRKIRDHPYLTGFHSASAIFQLLADTQFRPLLSNKVDTNTTDNQGNTVLHYAAYYGDTSTLSYLLNNRADADLTARKLSSSFHEPKRMERDLCWTPMHIAAFRGFLDIIRTLLDTGANKSSVDIEGATPLDVAIEHDRTHLWFELLGLGYSPQSGSRNLSKLLQQALFEGRYDMVHLLKEKGARVLGSNWAVYGDEAADPRTVSVQEAVSRRLLNLQDPSRKTVSNSEFCDHCAEAIYAYEKGMVMTSFCTKAGNCLMYRLIQDTTHERGQSLITAVPISIHLEFDATSLTKRFSICGEGQGWSHHPVRYIPSKLSQTQYYSKLLP